jgi:lipopolysaccharide/colanic/teichoic acid biosynthesis glycosyltransferase
VSHALDHAVRRRGELRVITAGEGAPGPTRRPLDGPLQAGADVAAAALAAVVAPTDAVFMTIALASTALAFAARCPYHRPRLQLSPVREGVRIVPPAAVPLILACIEAGVSTKHSDRVVFGAAALVALVVSRSVATMLIARNRRRGAGLRPAVIVAGEDSTVAQRVAQAVREHPEYGLRVVGRIGGTHSLNLPEMHLTDLRSATVPGLCIIIATHLPVGSDVAELIQESDGTETFVALRHLEAGAVSSDALDRVWTVPMAWLPMRSKRRLWWSGKRLVDVSVAAVLIAVSLPVMLAIGLVIRCSSRGRVLYRQRRVGRRGTEFELLKFRTLPITDGIDEVWSAADRPDVDPIGRALRRTGLDELPQLFNVLRGDMSLVGPRPERPLFARRFAAEVPAYRRRHRFVVGLTGLAQINGLRGDTSITDRAAFDTQYIDEWSLEEDLKILLRTPRTLFRRGPH